MRIWQHCLNPGLSAWSTVLYVKWSVTASPGENGELDMNSTHWDSVISGWACASHILWYNLSQFTRNVGHFSTLFVHLRCEKWGPCCSVWLLKSCCVASVFTKSQMRLPFKAGGVVRALKHIQFSVVSREPLFSNLKIRYRKLSRMLPGGNAGRAV